MAEHTRFGPAGVPPMFRLMGADLPDVPRLLREEGLDALEYEAVRWGPKPQIRQELAEKLGAAAKENDVDLAFTARTSLTCQAKKTSSRQANGGELHRQLLLTGWEHTSWFFIPGFMVASKRNMRSKPASTPSKRSARKCEALGFE